MNLPIGYGVYLVHKGTLHVETYGIVVFPPKGKEKEITLNCHWVHWKDRLKPELTHNSRIHSLVPINKQYKL